VPVPFDNPTLHSPRGKVNNINAYGFFRKDKLILGDEVSRAIDQRGQKVEGPRTQRYFRAVLQQASLVELQLERPETTAFGKRRGCHPGKLDSAVGKSTAVGHRARSR
jgi:hypothetical protein